VEGAGNDQRVKMQKL